MNHFLQRYFVQHLLSGRCEYKCQYAGQYEAAAFRTGMGVPITVTNPNDFFLNPDNPFLPRHTQLRTAHPQLNFATSDPAQDCFNTDCSHLIGARMKTSRRKDGVNLNTCRPRTPEIMQSCSCGRISSRLTNHVGMIIDGLVRQQEDIASWDSGGT